MVKRQQMYVLSGDCQKVPSNTECGFVNFRRLDYLDIDWLYILPRNIIDFIHNINYKVPSQF